MGGRKFALKGHLTWSWKNGAVRSYGTSVACRPDRDSPRPSSTDEGQLETATRLALWAETSEPMSNWGGASSNTETWLPFWTADPLECAPALMCIHDCREKRGKARLWENPNTHWLTHTHYRVVNPRFDGLTLSYCCEGGKKNKRRVTLLITLTSPLRPEEEEEEDQCITKKKPEAFSLPLCPPVFSESRLPPGETSDWGTFLIALQFYNTFGTFTFSVSFTYKFSYEDNTNESVQTHSQSDANGTKWTMNREEVPDGSIKKLREVEVNLNPLCDPRPF